MKKKTIIIAVSFLLIFMALISSCTQKQGSDTTKPSESIQSTDQTTTERIKELEAQILTLIQNQKISETERRNEIAALTAELEKLKSSEAPPSETESKAPSATQSSFRYTLDSGRATITEISSDEKSIVIPSTIDGYNVYAIGSEVLSSKSVESITISAGIEKIDWFAFKNCSSLSSATIPDSVVSIGYGAFDNVAKSFTIVCSKNSFAHQYAQSYGITYDIT